MTDGRTEATALRQLLDMLPIYAVRVGYRVDSTIEERSIADAAWAAHRAWTDALSDAAPDEALGRCPVLIQCHRETGHEGPHEARETLDTGRVPDMDRSKT